MSYAHAGIRRAHEVGVWSMWWCTGVQKGMSQGWGHVGVSKQVLREHGDVKVYEGMQGYSMEVFIR